MAKRQTQETYKDVRTDKENAAKDYSSALAETSGLGSAINPASTGFKGDLITAYQGMPRLESPAPVQYQNVSNSGQIGTGNLDSVLGSYRDFGATSGGFNTDEAKQSIGENIGGFKEIGKTGGLTGENIARMRGLGGFDTLLNNGGLSISDIDRLRGKGIYDEFAATGGYDDAARANIKLQALSPIASYATGTQDELARRRALTGGYAPGFDSANRALMRDTGRQIADTSLNANVMLQDRINQGRLAGVGGLTSAEQNLQQLRTGNMLNAAQGVAGSEAQMTGQLVGNRLQGLTGAQNSEMQFRDSVAKYRLAGLNGEQATAAAIADVEGRNIGNQNQVNMFNAGNQLQNSQFNTNVGLNVGQTNLGQYNAGLSGLQGLYNTDVGQYQSERDRAMALLNARANTNLNYLGNQSQLATQPGIGGQIVNGIGAAAGMAGAFYNPTQNYKMVS